MLKGFVLGFDKKGMMKLFGLKWLIVARLIAPRLEHGSNEAGAHGSELEVFYEGSVCRE